MTQLPHHTHTHAGPAVHACQRVPMGGHNVTATAKNAITSWWIKSITSANPLNLEPRFAQMLGDFPLIHFRRRIHPVRGGKAVVKKH